ncbi:hypothetical protein N665_0303s0049 [Sinapis alba]|nr:hypothetical protein N665_0303s0049 [Sinapis alba]
MGVDMILIDAQSTLMAATVTVSRLAIFRHQLHAGSTFTLAGFDVVRCNPNFRLTDSLLTIRFRESTRLAPLAEPVSPILMERYRFRDYDSLYALANTNTQLPDVIGELIAVKSTVSDNPQGRERVMATIKIDNSGVSVTLSMFEAQALVFHTKLEDFGCDPRVVVATTVNPRIVGGRLFLNATSGTLIFFDKETHAGEVLISEMVCKYSGKSAAPSLLRGYTKIEPLSISELNRFVITARPQDIEFVCTGKVTGIRLDRGWCYVSCSSCSKKLQRTVSSFTCISCNNPNAVGVLRYRVEMSIADDTDEGLFVGFDGEMTKLHNMRAYEAGHLMAGPGENPEAAQPPPFLADMVGNTYSFQVSVRRFNFTSNHQTFTIAHIMDERDRLPLPEFDASPLDYINYTDNDIVRFTQDGDEDEDDDDEDDMPFTISLPTNNGAGYGDRGESSSAEKNTVGNVTKNAPVIDTATVINKAVHE